MVQIGKELRAGLVVYARDDALADEPDELGNLLRKLDTVPQPAGIWIATYGRPAPLAPSKGVARVKVVALFSSAIALSAPPPMLITSPGFILLAIDRPPEMVTALLPFVTARVPLE